MEPNYKPLFKLHNDKGYKLELILQPLCDNVMINIDEKEYKKLKFKYKPWKYLEYNNNVILFADNIVDDSHLHHMLTLEYKKDFKQYYTKINGGA